MERMEWLEGRGRDDFGRRFIFSLIRYRHRPGTWLFGGIFEVIERMPAKDIVRLSKNKQVLMSDRFWPISALRDRQKSAKCGR